eukprot:CAMPEP_0174370148 /NCGR_PEP_ID=MMETSP0811_2-20130205/95111_1 /TAXON_ID=73025 ORGANISM="Eutreptiella gymnastica-like, Strain CCMP1594" /NCGR_SAMPLE_ID=MMETSP0811_2 /ASSEMBLY_ACC=CAM_ASM_000667 /LENGTH=99 /DNA_ID=CAMNT_0015515275 /DNA_START=1124 /DNA_END=1420 /DNA_ORIENTATION=+
MAHPLKRRGRAGGPDVQEGRAGVGGGLRPGDKVFTPSLATLCMGSQTAAICDSSICAGAPCHSTMAFQRALWMRAEKRLTVQRKMRLSPGLPMGSRSPH